MRDTAIKAKLLALCQEKIAQRIATIESVLQSIEESRNNETKSSVGDKYETGRAMMQMEEEKNRGQLLQALRAQQILATIDPERISDEVQLGSLVISNKLKYYCAIGLGKLQLGTETIYAVSPDSPIGRLLIGKKADDQVELNQQLIKVVAVL
ncbi:MAG: 3-oxoacyl-ACP synthase [Bacteroidota bacterium]